MFGGVITALLLFSSHPAKAQRPEESTDRQAIEQVIEQYVETINHCDTALVNRIWSHADYVSFIAPSGRYATHHEIRDKLVVGLFGDNFRQRNLRKEELKINVHGDTAWAEFSWVFDAVRNDGTPHNTRGRETQILERDPKGRWLLVHIHYSSR